MHGVDEGSNLRERNLYDLPLKYRVLDVLLIECIPLKDVFKETVCSSTCQILFEKSISASTTNSIEVSLSIKARAKPFAVGMTSVTTIDYGSGSTLKASMATLSWSVETHDLQVLAKVQETRAFRVAYGLSAAKDVSEEVCDATANLSTRKRYLLYLLDEAKMKLAI
ncbi:hypothetical protein BGZ92_011181 [Podila epicladia]|nr:hypothetical protein BGZ92_011181 [Podila epicladia]